MVSFAIFVAILFAMNEMQLTCDERHATCSVPLTGRQGGAIAP
jgi:hypothetical protein